MENKIFFDEDYTGERFTYGLTYRPLDMASIPKGWIVGSTRHHSDFSFGTIDYPMELTDQQVYSYELTRVK